MAMGDVEWSEAARKDMQLWEEAQTFEGLCELTARFMEGGIRYIPTLLGEQLDSESESIATYLAAFNRAGFLTTSSQPGLNQVSCRQRAFVDGFALESTVVKIQKVILFSDLYVLVAVPDDSGGCTIPITVEGFRQCTWAGWATVCKNTGQFSDLELFERACSDSAMQDLEQAWYVCVVDLCWGRKDYLWETLARELCFTLELDPDHPMAENNTPNSYPSVPLEMRMCRELMKELRQLDRERQGDEADDGGEEGGAGPGAGAEDAREEN